MLNIKEDEQLSILNHSCAHLMAHAIKRLYPDSLFWVGPVIDDGFYYDVDLKGEVIKEEELKLIEEEMRKISKEKLDLKRIEISKEDALERFKDDPYKIDLINNMEENSIITIYEQGDFVDLCRGPHVPNTKEIKYFKLLKVSGAYFKGDSKNKMLQRIYGICFSNKEDLENYLKWLEEVKERDHKKIGKELELFMISEYAQGFPIWLPNGMTLLNILENFWYEEHAKEGYKFIKTPIMLNKELWEISGHWNNYRENMYTSVIDDKEYAIKPMNCPGGILVYKNSLHSYKDFPLRVGELGLVHRHEASGALNGLFRVRALTQDDAHIFITEEQIETEIINLIAFIDRIYSVFGLTYTIELSTRPEDKYIGAIEIWDKAELALKRAVVKANRDYKLNSGDGAFYGPKLDFHIKDSLGRTWQCATIQLDLNLPERFDLTYIDQDGSKKRPVMLHRVIYGSLERFMGILIEHYGGAFPLWLSPIQVNIIPINNEFHLDYADQIKELLIENNIRITFDDREEKLGYKIREAQIKKIPYNVIIGNNERDNETISYRKYSSEETVTISKEEFIEMLKDEINNKK
jgi:threonyl-tRNA synthetase